MLNLEPIKKDEFCLIVSQHDKKTNVYLDGPASNNSWKSFKGDMELNGEELISIIRIPFTAPENTELCNFDFQNSMEILHRLLRNDDIQIAFESLLTQVFAEGQLSVKNKRE